MGAAVTELPPGILLAYALILPVGLVSTIASATAMASVAFRLRWHSDAVALGGGALAYTAVSAVFWAPVIWLMVAWA